MNQVKKQSVVPAQRRNIKPAQLKQVSRNGETPATFFQESLFLGHLIYPENASLNTIVLWTVEGCEDEQTFCEAFADTIVKHEIFRTYFKLGEDMVYQVVVPPDKFDCSLPFIDLTHLDKTAQDDELYKYVNDLGYSPFDLEQPALYRARLFKTGPKNFVFLRVAHHTIMDLTTNYRQLKDISDYYDQRSAGNQITAPTPEFQFVDYAAWERHTLTEQYLKPQLEYWKNLVTGSPEMIRLPIDFQRPEKIGPNFKIESFDIPNELWQKAKELAASTEASLFQVNLTILSIFLSLCTGDDDFFIASAVDHRRARGLPLMMGPVINDFVIRAQINRELTCLEFLSEMKSRTIKAYMNSDLDYERLLANTGLKRNLSINPLFQVEFFYYPKTELLDNCKVQFKEIFFEGGSGELDLVWKIVECKQNAETCFRYNAELFKASTVKTMVAQLMNLYAAVVANPVLKISQLPHLKLTKNLEPASASTKLKIVADSKPKVPMTELEKLITEEWKKVLKVDHVNSEENFFEAGGSLSGLAHIFRTLLRQDHNLNFKDLFRYPTIGSLSDFISQNRTRSKTKAA